MIANLALVHKYSTEKEYLSYGDSFSKTYYLFGLYLVKVKMAKTDNPYNSSSTWYYSKKVSVELVGVYSADSPSSFHDGVKVENLTNSGSDYYSVKMWIKKDDKYIYFYAPKPFGELTRSKAEAAIKSGEEFEYYTLEDRSITGLVDNEYTFGNVDFGYTWVEQDNYTLAKNKCLLMLDEKIENLLVDNQLNKNGFNDCFRDYKKEKFLVYKAGWYYYIKDNEYRSLGKVANPETKNYLTYDEFLNLKQDENDNSNGAYRFSIKIDKRYNFFEPFPSNGNLPTGEYGVCYKNDISIIKYKEKFLQYSPYSIGYIPFNHYKLLKDYTESE